MTARGPDRSSSTPWWADRSTLYVAGRDHHLDRIVQLTIIAASLTGAAYAAVLAHWGFARDDAGTVLLWCLTAAALICATLWTLTATALSGPAATWFAIAVDLAVGAGIGVLDNPQVMFAACILFVIVSAFVTVHVPPVGLAAHMVFATAVTVTAATIMVTWGTTPIPLAVMGVTVWIWAIAGAPLAVRKVWLGISATAQLANRDPLTGLLNRGGLAHAYTDLTSTVSAATMVIVVDIDNFKTINDRYGHAVGDAVIIETAHHLAHHFGPGTAVARTGGEEFTIIATGTHPQLTALVLATPTRTFGIHGPAVTMSVGAAFCDFRSARHVMLHQAMGAADHAMYTAKRGGGNSIQIAPPTQWRH